MPAMTAKIIGMKLHDTMQSEAARQQPADSGSDDNPFRSVYDIQGT